MKMVLSSVMLALLSFVLVPNGMGCEEIAKDEVISIYGELTARTDKSLTVKNKEHGQEFTVIINKDTKLAADIGIGTPVEIKVILQADSLPIAKEVLKHVVKQEKKKK